MTYSSNSVMTVILNLEANEDPMGGGSCPWVYPWDGNGYVRDNDIYSVARYSKGEYRDYYLLQKPLVARDGEYPLEIRETTGEDSWTNMVGMKAVDHAVGVRVGPDEAGVIHAYRPADMVAPVTAVSGTGGDVRTQVATKDDDGYPAYSGDTVELDFGEVDVSEGARLVLRVKGFITGSGEEKPYTEPPAIVVETLDGEGNWQEVGRLKPRFEWSEGVYDLSPYLPALNGDWRVRLRSISHGVKYHEIDYVGLSVGAEPDKVEHELSLISAEFNGGDVVGVLGVADNDYVTMSEGDKFSVSFSTIEPALAERDFIFVSEGYYIPHGMVSTNADEGAGVGSQPLMTDMKMGGYYVYTWSGSSWITRENKLFPTSDGYNSFDLSAYLPDANGEYKVRIYQDCDVCPAAIDYIGLKVGPYQYALASAQDLRYPDGVGPNKDFTPLAWVDKSDDVHYDIESWDDGTARWSEYKFANIALILEANEDPMTGSCPWVFPWNGEQFARDNDIYSVARYPAGEYRDYYLLQEPLVARDGEYPLEIRETTGEDSWTDMVGLKAVDHEVGVRVGPDEAGGIHAYRPADMVAPVTAVSGTGGDVRSQVATNDDYGYPAYSGDTVELDFGGADVSGGARLVVRVKGFITGSGEEKPYIGPPAIVVETPDGNGGWKEVGRLKPRFEWSEGVYDLSQYLNDLNGGRRVRLSSISHGVKYHEIDYVGLSVGAEPEKVVHELSLITAEFNGGDVKGVLGEADNDYVAMSEGEKFSVSFSTIEPALAERDFIFISEGYYIPYDVVSTKLGDMANGLLQPGMSADYEGFGGYYVYTWNGSDWITREQITYPITDAVHGVDLSAYLPDANGEYKVRIMQDCGICPAAIDYISLRVGTKKLPIFSATDLRYSSVVTSSHTILRDVGASDDVRYDIDNWDNVTARWSEYEFASVALILEANEDPMGGGSCPWVYPWDGTGYVRDNDIYSVARYSKGEYKDYYLLQKPLVARDGEYPLEVRETTGEDSWTNMVGLKAVDHAVGVRVGPDEDGDIHAYRPAEMVAPLTAVSGTGGDVSALVGTLDNAGYPAYSGDTVELDFGDVDVTGGARLVLRVKGFITGSGEEKPYIGPPAIVVETLDENGSWEEVGRLKPRFEWSEGVYDLSQYLPDLNGGKRVRLRSISHAVKYHEIDYVGLSVGAEPLKEIHELSLTSAQFRGGDVLGVLGASDDNYVAMSEGEKFSVSFSTIEAALAERDFIFISEGYYIPHDAVSTKLGDVANGLLQPGMPEDYWGWGGYYVYTWGGSSWITREHITYPMTDTVHGVDLSAYLPDANGEYKVRIMQDCGVCPAAIDRISLQVGSVLFAISYARDLRYADGTGPNPTLLNLVRASDDSRYDIKYWDNGGARWSEYIFKPGLILEANEDPENGSCPWVYPWDGEQFARDNDIYSVARYLLGKYKDYYLLQKPLVVREGEYPLEIRETTGEDSWTDMVGLKAVDHEVGVRVGPDEAGGIHAYRPADMVAPVTAVSGTGGDVRSQVATNDDDGYPAYSGDTVELDFGDVDVSEGARLVVRVKGFIRGVGEEKPYTEPPAIVVETPDGSGNWVEAGRLKPRFEWSEGVYDVSPYLTNLNGGRRVRLSSISHGVKYHEIDYVGLSVGAEPEKVVHELSLMTAEFNGGDVVGVLGVADNDYVEMSEGDKFSVSFSTNEPVLAERDFIFVSEGYYIPHNTYEIYTWNGSSWIKIDEQWYANFVPHDEINAFDLSSYLPDPDGDYKVRIYQNCTVCPAAIDYIAFWAFWDGLTQYPLRSARDLRYSEGVGPNPSIREWVGASDEVRYEIDLWDTRDPRWSEYVFNPYICFLPLVRR